MAQVFGLAHMQRPLKKVAFSIFAIRKINVYARRIFTQSFFFYFCRFGELGIVSANEDLKILQPLDFKI